VVYTRFIVPLVDKYGEQLAAIEKEIKDQLNRPIPAEKPSHEDGPVPNGDSVVIPDLPVENEGENEIIPPPAKDDVPTLEPSPEVPHTEPPPAIPVDEPKEPSPNGPVDNHSPEKDDHGCAVLTHTDVSNLHEVA